MINYDKFELEIRRTPLWELKKQICQAELELKLLKTDPSTNHDEIVELDLMLSKYRHEYAERVAKLRVG